MKLTVFNSIALFNSRPLTDTESRCGSAGKESFCWADEASVSD